MKLLKIIGIFFLIYFIRRFMQMYKVMARIQKEQENLRRQQSSHQTPQTRPEKNSDVIEADFKIVDLSNNLDQ